MIFIQKALHRYTMFDLLIIAVMAALGIAVKPIVVPLAHMVGAPLMIPSGALAGGLYMMWMVVALGITGKYGTATLVALVQALLVLFTGVVGSHGIMSLVSYTLPGIALDLVMFLIGHRICCLPCAFLAGAVANLTGTYSVNSIFFSLPFQFLVLIMAIALLSGGIGGIIAWQLLKVLRKYKIVKTVPQRRKLILGKKQEQTAEDNQTAGEKLKTEDGVSAGLTEEKTIY
ncbi:MAG: ECF transporter S component [Bacillota bacterium]|jgi:hypothetical protein